MSKNRKQYLTEFKVKKYLLGFVKTRLFLRVA